MALCAAYAGWLRCLVALRPHVHCVGSPLAAACLTVFKASRCLPNKRAMQSSEHCPILPPSLLQLEVGDLVPVVAAVAARAAAGGCSPALARVTAVERLSGDGVFMPHTLTGAAMCGGAGLMRG